MTMALRVQDFSFSRSGRRILENISFTVNESESVGIAGPNGAGKSTLLWCVLGLLHGDGLVEKRTSASAVFQNPEDQLFMPSLLEDLMLPLRCDGMGEAEAESAARLALHDFDMEDAASTPASELSLGQRKRAALALAFIRKPGLLLLDEPTAELDPRASRLLSNVLRTVRAARLVASHDLAFIELTCSRLMLIDHGRIVADAPTGEILSDPVLLERHGLM